MFLFSPTKKSLSDTFSIIGAVGDVFVALLKSGDKASVFERIFNDLVPKRSYFRQRHNLGREQNGVEHPHGYDSLAELGTIRHHGEVRAASHRAKQHGTDKDILGVLVTIYGNWI